MSHASPDKQKQRGTTSVYFIDFFGLLFLGVAPEIKVFFSQKRGMKEGYLNQTRARMLIAGRCNKMARGALWNTRGKKEIMHVFS